MANPGKVDFISVLKDPSNIKWYHTQARRLRSEEVAEKLQDLVDERAHQGYEFVQTLQSWGSLAKKDQPAWRDAGQYSNKPDGLLVIFRKV